MKELLQLSPSKMVGYWFLTEAETVIRLYGFVHQPYVLPTFLTVRIFSLEFLRQKLIVEEEHILSSRKNLGMKFPWEVGPYIVKNRASLLVIDNTLKSMGFPLGFAINYDPHQMISKRRHANSNKYFEHTEVARLREVTNWGDYPNQALDNVYMEMDSMSSLRGNNSPPMDLSNIVVAARNVSSLIIFS